MKKFIEYGEADTADIQAVAKYANHCVSETWEDVLNEQREELLRMFEQYGDRAYGVYIQKFTAPLFDELIEAGFQVRPGFHLSDSVENWGPPEERERCAWYAVKRPDGTSLGTLVLQVFHSHTQFHIPEPPRVFGIEETEREAVLDKIGAAALRTGHVSRNTGYKEAAGDIQKWEYSTETGLGDYAGYPGFDYALAKWGRHGWELVSVTPHQDRLIAFFKRPAP
ncbi:DUF6022 family protein [Paenibacillus hamazuiensis]|uniref:DUF6022 family protein n=1 Tax=Paenibacillus hamazuiensis TaxID=2936508 RepID=UPI00200D6529|nr:DUF6022 family protein [Paenibacillus hamazuiensis]